MTVFASDASGPTRPVPVRASSTDDRVRRRRQHYAALRRTVAGDVDRLRHRVHAARLATTGGVVLALVIAVAGMLAVVPAMAAVVTVGVLLGGSAAAARRVHRARQRLVRAQSALERAEREAHRPLRP